LEDHKELFVGTHHEVDPKTQEITGVSQRPLTEFEMKHVIHDQWFMLQRRHLDILSRDYGVQPWHFEQYEDEAVFIPAGCAHQASAHSVAPCSFWGLGLGDGRL
jgi:hypothetical protein